MEGNFSHWTSDSILVWCSFKNCHIHCSCSFLLANLLNFVKFVSNFCFNIWNILFLPFLTTFFPPQKIFFFSERLSCTHACVCLLWDWSLTVAQAVIESNYSARSGAHLSTACTNHTHSFTSLRTRKWTNKHQHCWIKPPLHAHPSSLHMHEWTRAPTVSHTPRPQQNPPSILNHLLLLPSREPVWAQPVTFYYVSNVMPPNTLCWAEFCAAQTIWTLNQYYWFVQLFTSFTILYFKRNKHVLHHHEQCAAGWSNHQLSFTDVIF